MIISRIASIGLVLMAMNVQSPERQELKPSWTIALRDPFLRDRGGFQGTPEENRSCGIARWDRSHVLIYYLASTKHLAMRKPMETMEGSWSFSLEIVSTDNGKVEQSATVPAESVNSELAVVVGGLVESDRDHLIFYSRDFKRVDRAFTYTPLHGPMPFFKEGTVGDPERLYVTDDQRQVVLVDSEGHRSHFFLFDGATFERKRDWVVPEVDWQAISIGDGGLLYTDFDTHRQVFWTTFDGRFEKWKTAAISSDNRNCHVPIYVDSDTLLNVCQTIELVTRDNSLIIYHTQKKEVVLLPAAISADKHLAAVFKHMYRGGGILDLDEHRTRADLLIARLDGGHKVCEIPIVPLPRTQLAFNFANDPTLIVLNDATVTAYKDPCSN